MISLDEFLNLPTPEVAKLVRSTPQVCVFPNDGTRRWFLLEHGQNGADDMLAHYMTVASRRHAELYRMFFDHGIDTLLAPVFGGETLKRGDVYMQQFALKGLLQFAENPDFLNLYDECQLRVRFYGDYLKNLAGIPGAEQVIGAFEALTVRTRAHTRGRLFFGIFANDSTDTLAELAVRSFQQTSVVPDRRKMVELYYGEYIEPVSIFIGFEKFCVYDYPLLASGIEDLYFMVAPSSYFEERQLRMVLYDHLYTRRVDDPDYATTPPENFDWWKKFYTANKEVVLGTGVMKAGIWTPNPNLIIPE